MPTDIPKEDGWYQIRLVSTTEWNMARRRDGIWRAHTGTGHAFTVYSDRIAEYRGPIPLDGLAELTELRQALAVERAELERRQDEARKLRATVKAMEASGKNALAELTARREDLEKLRVENKSLKGRVDKAVGSIERYQDEAKAMRAALAGLIPWAGEKAGGPSWATRKALAANLAMCDEALSNAMAFFPEGATVYPDGTFR